MNVPPREAIVEIWVTDGAGGHSMIGSTELLVEADSINISSGYYGYTEQVYPDSCLSPCETSEDTAATD